MHMTKNFSNQYNSDRILVTTEELKNLLGCGRSTAVKIGTEANAKVTIGRRVLWSKTRILQFIEKLTT